MKNSNDIIGNRTRDLPACSAVPQPTVPPRARLILYQNYIMYFLFVLIHCLQLLIWLPNFASVGQNEKHKQQTTVLLALLIQIPPST